MNRFTFIDSITNLAESLIAKAGEKRAEYFAKEDMSPRVLGRKKERSSKKNLKMLVILAACLAVLIPLGIFVTKLATGGSADVRLESLSGGAIDGNPYESAPDEYMKAPGGISLLSSAGNNENIFTFIDKDEDADEKKNKNNGVSTGKITAAPQTVIMFDTSEYATIEISLDNPYEYYIADFYLICSEPGAQVYVDNQWFPLDGSVKVRWTGATNRYASYTVYIPSVEQGASIRIEDMRYLNNTEIAVDMKKHNVADIYHMEAPLYTQFIVNTMEKYLFRIITSENCTGFDVEGADPSSFDPKYSDLYEVTEDGGAYKINYTFKVPGTDIEGHGEITSEEITLLRVKINYGGVQTFYYHYEDPDRKFAGRNEIIMDLLIAGSGMTYHDARIDDKNEIEYKGARFYDQEFYVSIDDGPLALATYTENFIISYLSSKNTNALLFNSIDFDFWGTWDPISIKIYWNGYVIYSFTYDWHSGAIPN